MQRQITVGQFIENKKMHQIGQTVMQKTLQGKERGNEESIIYEF